MRCEDYAHDIAGLLDGDLPPARQREVERHVEHCPACGELVADLRTIQGAAFTLDRLEPPARVWTRIEERLATERPAASRLLAWPDRAAWGTWLAAAAALLLATLVGVYPLLRREAAPATAGVEEPATGDALVASVEADLRAAEGHYEKAIQGLELIASSDTDALDPQVAAVLQKNLQVIDQAIGESRAALREQPASQNAQESLFDAMRSKVALLQQTVELINEMRKGNQAEAGRIIQGINQP